MGSIKYACRWIPHAIFLRWLRQVSYLKFSYESMVPIEAMGQSFPCVDSGLACTRYSQNGNLCPVDEAALFKGAELDDHLGIAANLACLIAWIVILRILGYFALKYLNRPQSSRNLKKSKPLKRKLKART